MTNQMPELKPCPFCKGAAERETTICDDLVRCSWCRATLRVDANDGINASFDVVNLWNRRADLAQKTVTRGLVYQIAHKTAVEWVKNDDDNRCYEEAIVEALISSGVVKVSD